MSTEASCLEEVTKILNNKDQVNELSKELDPTDLGEHVEAARLLTASQNYTTNWLRNGASFVKNKKTLEKELQPNVAAKREDLLNLIQCENKGNLKIPPSNVSEQNLKNDTINIDEARKPFHEKGKKMNEMVKKKGDFCIGEVVKLLNDHAVNAKGSKETNTMRHILLDFGEKNVSQITNIDINFNITLEELEQADKKAIKKVQTLSHLKEKMAQGTNNYKEQHDLIQQNTKELDQESPKAIRELERLLNIVETGENVITKANSMEKDLISCINTHVNVLEEKKTELLQDIKALKKAHEVAEARLDQQHIQLQDAKTQLNRDKQTHEQEVHDLTYGKGSFQGGYLALQDKILKSIKDQKDKEEATTSMEIMYQHATQDFEDGKVLNDARVKEYEKLLDRTMEQLHDAEDLKKIPKKVVKALTASWTFCLRQKPDKEETWRQGSRIYLYKMAELTKKLLDHKISSYYTNELQKSLLHVHKLTIDFQLAEANFQEAHEFGLLYDGSEESIEIHNAYDQGKVKLEEAKKLEASRKEYIKKWIHDNQYIKLCDYMEKEGIENWKSVIPCQEKLIDDYFQKKKKIHKKRMALLSAAESM